METHFIIASDAFPSLETEEEGVNYDCGDHSIFGKRLAEWLRDGLTAKGWQIADCFAEDWGWTVELEHAASCPFFIGCSNIDPEPDFPDGPLFRIFTEPDQPVFRHWFRKHDITDQLTRLCRDLAALIDEDARVTLVEAGIDR